MNNSLRNTTGHSFNRDEWRLFCRCARLEAGLRQKKVSTGGLSVTVSREKYIRRLAKAVMKP